MRRTILSRRTMDELNRAVAEQHKAKVPFIRFIQANNGRFHVIDMFSNVCGKYTKSEEYETEEVPKNESGTLVIIEDI